MSRNSLLDALQRNDVEQLRIEVDNSTFLDINRLFSNLASEGDLQKVTMLLPFADPLSDNSWALYLAARNGRHDVVEFLIPHSDPLAEYSRALHKAAAQGHVECVKLLIPVSNPYDDHSAALWSAMLWEHTECLKLLIPVSDPKSDHSRALQAAVGLDNFEGFCLLYPVSDGVAAREYGREDYHETFDRMEMRYLKQKLEESVHLNSYSAQKGRKI